GPDAPGAGGAGGAALLRGLGPQADRGQDPRRPLRGGEGQVAGGQGASLPAGEGGPDMSSGVEYTDGFLERPPVGPVLPPSESGEEPVPGQIGPYAVRGTIGEAGGFGVVYLAVRGDGEYQERVAIKVLKRGLDTDDVLRRFRNERQALAALRRHPNIVALLDGGSTADGRPYFVMEYVEGKPLDQYCDDHRLPIEERLRVFLTVCGAVQYAHQNLLIHRDLKPANILVGGGDAEGDHRVKLLDFGIAKCINPELAGQAPAATAPGRPSPMTPEYASPAQIRGGTTSAATDLYGLGVILYELLTGHLPFPFGGPRSTPRQIERVICEQDPERPSAKVTTTEERVRRDGTTARITPE